MSKLVQLQQTRAAKVKEQQTLIDERNATEERSFTSEQSKAFSDLTVEIRGLDAEITQEKQIIEAEKRSAVLLGDSIAKPSDKKGGEKRSKQQVMAGFSMKRALSLQSKGRELDGAEAEVNAIAIEELRNNGTTVRDVGFNIPSEMMFRADSHTVTQDSGNFGGTLVKEDAGVVVPTFVNRLSIQDLGVNVISNLVGDYPLHSAGEFQFQNVEETEALTMQKSPFGKRVLKPLRTGMVTGISNQLLLQSSVNVDRIVSQQITNALNNRLLEDLINGDGVGPNTLGLLNDAVFESTASEGPLTLEKILELEGAVDDEDSPYQNNVFLIHKKLAAIAKAVKLDAGSGNFLMDKENKLYGTDTYKTSKVPVLTGAALNYPVLYGDFSSVTAGFWNGMNIFVDPYSLSDSGQRKLIVNVYRDIKASNPKAFAVNKAITLS